jgi:hypothetical protein
MSDGYLCETCAAWYANAGRCERAHCAGVLVPLDEDARLLQLADVWEEREHGQRGWAALAAKVRQIVLMRRERQGMSPTKVA